MQAAKKQFGLSTNQRLKKPQDFKRVYATKYWGHSSHHSFNVEIEPLEQENKIGITVSKKVSKLAVKRNHLKRLVREFYRLNQKDLETNTQHDYAVNIVITLKASANKASKNALDDSLQSLWDKLLKWQRWYNHQHLKAEQV